MSRTWWTQNKTDSCSDTCLELVFVHERAAAGLLVLAALVRDLVKLLKESAQRHLRLGQQGPLRPHRHGAVTASLRAQMNGLQRGEHLDYTLWLLLA